jgi:hypothetical protein
VNLTPVARITENEVASAQELEDIVARAEDLSLKALTATHQVPDPFFGRRGDTNGSEFADSVESAQLSGVVAVELALFAGAGGNEGRGDDVTVDSPGGEFTVEYVASTTGFITGTDLPPPSPSVEEPTEFSEVVGELFDDFGFGSVIDENGDHDGVLVDVHPNVNDGARHGAGPPIGCDLACRMWHWRETGSEPR